MSELIFYIAKSEDEDLQDYVQDNYLDLVYELMNHDSYEYYTIYEVDSVLNSCHEVKIQPVMVDKFEED